MEEELVNSMMVQSTEEDDDLDFSYINSLKNKSKKKATKVKKKPWRKKVEKKQISKSTVEKTYSDNTKVRIVTRKPRKLKVKVSTRTWLSLENVQDDSREQIALSVLKVAYPDEWKWMTIMESCKLHNISYQTYHSYIVANPWLKEWAESYKQKQKDKIMQNAMMNIDWVISWDIKVKDPLQKAEFSLKVLKTLDPSLNEKNINIKSQSLHIEYSATELAEKLQSIFNNNN